MSEFEQRQYLLMQKCLVGFELGNLNLLALINSLRGLINVLEETNQTWKNSFRNEWWILEEVYAVASDREQTYLSEKEEILVYEANNAGLSPLTRFFSKPY
jgi:hypothetical protein